MERSWYLRSHHHPFSIGVCETKGLPRTRIAGYPGKDAPIRSVAARRTSLDARRAVSRSRPANVPVGRSTDRVRSFRTPRPSLPPGVARGRTARSERRRRLHTPAFVADPRNAPPGPVVPTVPRSAIGRSPEENTLLRTGDPPSLDSIRRSSHSPNTSIAMTRTQPRCSLRGAHFDLCRPRTVAVIYRE